jgi:hypothetical protein
MDEISNPNNDPPKINLIQPGKLTHRRDKRENIDIVCELRRNLSALHHCEICRRTDPNEEANRAFYKMTFVAKQLSSQPWSCLSISTECASESWGFGGE